MELNFIHWVSDVQNQVVMFVSKPDFTLYLSLIFTKKKKKKMTKLFLCFFSHLK